MANTLLTSQIITNELLRVFKNSLPFAAGASHPYDDEFKKVGASITMRDTGNFLANDGADITAQIQDVNDKGVPLTINARKNVAFQFTSQELTLSVDDFKKRYLNKAGLALANAFEIDGLSMAYRTTPNIVGTPGTTPSTALTYLLAGAVLDNNACPDDENRSIVLNPTASAYTVDGLKGLQNDKDSIGKQYRKGRMGHALGFDFAMGQNVRTHTVGSWGTSPAVDGAAQTGATLSIKALTNTTGSVKYGDKFTIAGVFAVNPVSGDALPDLRVFTVMADRTANGSGLVAAMAIYPPIKATGADKTVSALPADSAAITKVGTASTAYPMNVAYHSEAFCYAMVPLQMPQGVHFGARQTDPETGLSVRLVSQYDIKTDVFITRADIAYGWAPRRPEWATCIIG